MSSRRWLSDGSVIGKTLSQRREDIPLLVRHLVAKLGIALRRRVDTIPDDVMRTLQGHSWPGNVRELENVLQRALILSRGNALSLGDAWLPVLDTMTGGGESSTLTDVERRHIVRVLSGSHWRIEGAGGAAQVLGMKPSTLRSRMLKLGVARP